MSNLSNMLKLYIAVNDIEQKTLAVEIGVAQSTLTRFLQGKDVSMKSFGRLVAWLTREAA